MAFTNRWVCYSKVVYNYEDVKNRLGEYFHIGEGKRFPLATMIDLKPELVNANGSNYLQGTLYFQEESDRNDFEISDSRKLITKKDVVRNTHVVDFWISSNPGTILFRNSRDSSRKAMKIISRLVFDEEGMIKPAIFDIERIENDALSGVYSGLWTFGFKDRQGNISSAIAYGEAVERDTIYGQAVGAPRHSIGVMYRLEDEILKIRIYRSGTINILTDLEDPTVMSKAFRIIEEFRAYVMPGN